MSDELPQPDVLDSGGRVRRIVLALIVGAAAAAIAYAITTSMVDTSHAVTSGPYKFIAYMTGLAGIIGFLFTLSIANQFAKKKWERELVARAKIVR
jgi:Na+/H+ antiporter NhaC